MISPGVYIEEETKNKSRVVHWRKTTWKRFEEKSAEEIKGSSHRSRKARKKAIMQAKREESVNIIMSYRVI